jgi:hypothetical protein
MLPTKILTATTRSGTVRKRVRARCRYRTIAEITTTSSNSLIARHWGSSRTDLEASMNRLYGPKLDSGDLRVEIVEAQLLPDDGQECEANELQEGRYRLMVRFGAKPIEREIRGSHISRNKCAAAITDRANGELIEILWGASIGSIKRCASQRFGAAIKEGDFELREIEVVYLGENFHG